MNVEPGTYKIIRVDGTEETIPEKPTLRNIYRQIHCDTIDTVVLNRDRAGVPYVVMIVDDVGMIDEKPVNEKATEIYRAVCRPGTQASIHGDVAICRDEDFA